MEIDLQRIEQLNELTYMDYSGLFIRKVNKTRKVFGKTLYKIPLDNSYKAEVNACEYVTQAVACKLINKCHLKDVKQGGQYRLMPYKLPKKGWCDFHNDDTYIYPEVAAGSDWPLPMPCPLPAVRCFILICW